MPSIHEDIEPWLAASVHDQLSPEERTQLQEHLAGCESCRGLHQQELATHHMIATTLDAMKPDLAFEQRILASFRKRAPQRAGLVALVANLLRSRATQFAAIAAVLLTMVQVGRVLTKERPAIGLRTFPSLTGAMAPNEDMAEAMDDQALPVVAKASAPRASSAERQGRPSQAASGAATQRQMAAPAPESAPAVAAMQDAPEFTEERRANALPPPSDAAVVAPDVNRKLVRNAQVEVEVVKFEEAVQKITATAAELRGYVATSSSSKQANGKLRGVVVVKVLPETLDPFLAQLRALGELKNQTLGSEDVTKQYFDTDSRLKNARIMETRLLEILKTSSNKVADLLEVEKELGRVRASIEQMQGELKYMDALVAFATVTITLTEKDMDVPAAFLLQRRAQLALFSTEVEKTFAEVKGVVDGAKAQVSSSTLERDGSGEATARLVLLIVPEEADALIERIKSMGRVQNYNEQTDRIAQGGTGMAEGAKVERAKVELSLTISRNEQEPALQTTTLSILTSGVVEKVARLKEHAAQAGAEIRSSTFNRAPDGQEFANVSLRVAMKNYPPLISAFDQLGKVKDVSVQREDRRGTVNEETAPADINIRIYSQPSIVSDESGLIATIRRTLMQGVGALMWSLRMIGVAIAFFAPWVLVLGLVFYFTRRISRARKARRAAKE